MFVETKEHKHRLFKITTGQSEATQIDFKIKLRIRPFTLPTKPMRILAAPETL